MMHATRLLDQSGSPRLSFVTFSAFAFRPAAAAIQGLPPGRIDKSAAGRLG